MKVKDLIRELSKLPQDEEIYFCSYDNHYNAEVKKYIAENKNSDDLYLAGCGDGAYHALHIYDCIPTIIGADGGGEE